MDSEGTVNPIAEGERSTVPGPSTARAKLLMHGYAITDIEVMDPRWTWTVPFTFCARRESEKESTFAYNKVWSGDYSLKPENTDKVVLDLENSKEIYGTNQVSNGESHASTYQLECRHQ